MQIPVFNQLGEQIKEIQIPDRVFGLPMNADLLFQVTNAQLANTRQNIAHAKGRGEVRGGGKKPWAQKGTGRARHGSIRSPIWKGGGVTHGPTKERNFKKKVNAKSAKKALAVALSAKLHDGECAVVDAISIEQPRTKLMANIVTSFAKTRDWKQSSRAKKTDILLVVPSAKETESLRRASRNLPYLSVEQAADLNALKALSYKRILFLEDAIPALVKTFSRI